MMMAIEGKLVSAIMVEDQEMSLCRRQYGVSTMMEMGISGSKDALEEYR